MGHVALQYNGSSAGLGFETYPLANGDVGFLMSFLGGGNPNTNVLGS